MCMLKLKREKNIDDFVEGIHSRFLATRKTQMKKTFLGAHSSVGGPWGGGTPDFK